MAETDAAARESRGPRPERFQWKPGDLQISQCFDCRHRHDGSLPTCDAFPRGIPEEILDNDFDHREPHPEDNGIQFEPREEADQ